MRDKTNMKKAFLLHGLCAMLLCSCTSRVEFDTEGIKAMSVDVLSADENTIISIEFSEEDVTLIREMLSEQKQENDSGFVFAEGMYRINVQYDNNEVNLYPYCGNASTIRIGDRGATYIELDEEEQENLENILEKYIDITGGIWDWEEYEDN